MPGFSELTGRLERLSGAPASGPKPNSGRPIRFKSLAELKRYCAGEVKQGDEQAARILLAAKEAERTGRGTELLRAVNLSAVNRCDVQGEILQPGRRR
jgi:hypothetical protein